MISEVEREFQIFRIKGIISAADRMVWSKPDFPQDQKPEVKTLLQGISIGSSVVHQFEVHPRMKPKWVRIFNQTKQVEIDHNSKAAAYDPSTREITINPVWLSIPDDELRKTLYHEAATDNSNLETKISPTDYSAEEKERVIGILKEGFYPKQRPGINETYIVKSGFLKHIMSAGYFLSAFYGRQMEDLDEIYPTIHEMVTDQIVRRNGDIAYFDHDAKSGKLHIVGFESHQNFANMLFRVLKFIDWRDLLSAYRKGEFKQTLKEVEEKSNPQEYGSGIFIKLLEAMHEDETAIATLNDLFGAHFS